MNEVNEIIQATSVTKTYDTGTTKVNALNGVDLSIHRGEMVAVMGPSGCGKTTLLNCLSGLDYVTSGEVWLDGKNLADMSDRERTTYRANRMGFIFRVYNLLPVLNAVENVELPLLVSGIGSRKPAHGHWPRSTRSDWRNGRSTGPPSFPEGSGSG